VLGHLLSWGVKQKYVEHIPLPEIQKLNEIRWVGQRPANKTIVAVFAKLDERVIPLVMFMRETGSRREEGLSLKHNEIVLNAVPPVIVFSDNTKNAKDRQVPLTANAINAIKTMPGNLKFVFYHPESPSRWGTAHEVWNVTPREAAGYPWLKT
jgi:site-specific recombinase XerD